jgi:hypothetical protein
MATPLRPYAQAPMRRGLQVLADVLVVAWTVGWIWVATLVHGGMEALASAGFRLRDGAGGVASNLDQAGESMRRTPIVGDALAAPLGSAGSAAGDVADAGRQFGDHLSTAALPVAVLVVVLGCLPVVLPWAYARWRYARRAGSTALLLQQPGGQRLLALRAMAGRPTARLLAVCPDPVDAWDRNDPQVTAALANLELRALGMRRAASPS